MAIQPVQGTVQARCQLANRCPSCTFRAGFPAFGKSAIGGTYGIETAKSCPKAASCCLFFLQSRRIEPLSQLPRRKLALPRGRQFHSELQHDEVARPSSSRLQHTSIFAPLLLRISSKIRPFLLGPACQWQNTAGPNPRLSLSKILFREKFVSKCQARSQGLPKVLRLRNSDLKKNMNFLG